MSSDAGQGKSAVQAVDSGSGSSNSQQAGQSKPPDYAKKISIVVLAAVGATLLLTGATGSRLIKKPPSVKPPSSSSSTLKTAASAPAAPAKQSNANASAASRFKAATDRIVPLKPRRSSSSRLREIFQAASSSASTSTLVDFRANQHASWQPGSSSILGSLDTDNERASTSDDPNLQALPPVNAALDALKALTLATVITLGTAGIGVYALAHKLGAEDIPTFMHGLRNIIKPFATSVAETGNGMVPTWIRLKEKKRSEESIRSEKEDEEELRLIFEKGWRDTLKQLGETAPPEHNQNYDVGHGKGEEAQSVIMSEGDGVVEIRRS